jgi:hypothetical protein
VLELQALPLAIVFTVSATSKFIHPRETANTLGAYRLARGQWALSLALALGTAEVLVALGILLLRPNLAAVLALATLAGLTAFVVVNLLRGIRLTCGCFGRGFPSVLSWRIVARNGFLSLPALLLLAAPSSWLDSVDTHPLVPFLTIASLETCAFFLLAAALSTSSIAELASPDVVDHV